MSTRDERPRRFVTETQSPVMDSLSECHYNTTVITTQCRDWQSCMHNSYIQRMRRTDGDAMLFVGCSGVERPETSTIWKIGGVIMYGTWNAVWTVGNSSTAENRR